MKAIAALSMMALLLFLAGTGLADLADTVHNLSASGPGTIKASNETRMCVFCHTPHNASPASPLWNHGTNQGVTYTSYWSPTMDAYPQSANPQPDGASKLCLSCHDGTVALGALGSESGSIQFQGGVTTMPFNSRGYVGTNLSGDHPISFAVTQAIIDANNAKDNPLASLQAMRNSDPKVRLDVNDKVQCTACHDPHNDDNYLSAGVHFWNKPTYSDVCIVCHSF